MNLVKNQASKKLTVHPYSLFGYYMKWEVILKFCFWRENVLWIFK